MEQDFQNQKKDVYRFLYKHQKHPQSIWQIISRFGAEAYDELKQRGYIRTYIDKDYGTNYKVTENFLADYKAFYRRPSLWMIFKGIIFGSMARLFSGKL